MTPHVHSGRVAPVDASSTPHLYSVSDHHLANMCDVAADVGPTRHATAWQEASCEDANACVDSSPVTTTPLRDEIHRIHDRIVCLRSYKSVFRGCSLGAIVPPMNPYRRREIMLEKSYGTAQLLALAREIMCSGKASVAAMLLSTPGSEPSIPRSVAQSHRSRFHNIKEYMRLRRRVREIREHLGPHSKLIERPDDDELFETLNETEQVIEQVDTRIIRYITRLSTAIATAGVHHLICSEFPSGQRYLCTTMPWTIWPALVVLWGVCWMFEKSMLEEIVRRQIQGELPSTKTPGTRV